MADSLTVLDEIKKALFPLREEELTALETSVLAEGIRDPLVVWPRDGQLILVDGHYRYQLAQKHNLPFRVVEKHFANLEEALAWVDQNQLARRNLTDEQRRYLLGRIYERQKKAPVGFEDRNFSGGKIYPGGESHATAKTIAKSAGVSEKTIRSSAKFARALEAVKQISPEAADRILKGEVRDAITALPQVVKEPDLLPIVVEKIVQGERFVRKARAEAKRTLEEQQKPAGSELKVNKSFLSQTGDIVFDGFELRFTDCITAMKDIEEESIDCIITDPPYGISFSSPRYRNSRFSVMQNDQGVEAALAAIREFPRILAKDAHAYVFTRWDVYPWIVVSIPEGIRLTNLLVWDKGEGGHGMGDLDTYAPNYELIMLLEKGDRKLRGQRSSNVLRFRDIRFTDEPKYHPTQKPVDLIKFLIAKSTDPGETVLDPFAGSATTGIACLMTGRKFVGFEIDRTFEDAVRRRLAEVVNNG